MCDRLTSHLYKIHSGPVVHTLYSHSETREALGIKDKDESYVEVEWRDIEPEPEIRFPSSWNQDARDECTTFYSKFNTPMGLAMFLMPMAVVIDCSNTNISKLPDRLDKCIRLNCSYTNISKLPDKLDKCEYLNCSYTNITKLLDRLNSCVLLIC